MLASDCLFEFPLVHKVIVHGIFETILHVFWLTIATFPQEVRTGIIFRKLSYAKIRKNVDNQANFA